MNDVSFLYPLPAWSGRDSLLSPSTTGSNGQIFSKTLYDRVAPIIVDQSHGGPADVYASLKVVAVRVDPCFPGDASATPACLKQIRLVLQPTAQGASADELTTLDGGVHALYDLNAQQWSSLVADIKALRQLAAGKTTHQPLSVHPALASEGLNGPYTTALRTLVLKYAVEANLASFAFFRLVKSDAAWEFSAVDKNGANFDARTLPLLSSATTQTIDVSMNGAPSSDAPRSLFLQPRPTTPNVSLLVDSSVSLEDAKAAVRTAFLIDSPSSSFNPKTLDCGSCHLATRNVSFAVRTRSIDTSGFSEVYRSQIFDLSRHDDMGDDSRSLHSFGYFGKRSSISARTINESASIAAALAGP